MRKKGIAMVALVLFTVAAGDAEARSGGGKGGGRGGKSSSAQSHAPTPPAGGKPAVPGEAAKQPGFMPGWMKFILKPGRSGSKCDDERRAKGECK